jgi:hypothetical protein
MAYVILCYVMLCWGLAEIDRIGAAIAGRETYKSVTSVKGVPRVLKECCKSIIRVCVCVCVCVCKHYLAGKVRVVAAEVV